jgi:hypothetical protein
MLETVLPLGLNFYLSSKFRSRIKRLTYCANTSTLTRTRGSERHDSQLVMPAEVVLCRNICIAIFIVAAVEGQVRTGKPLGYAS